MVSNFDRELDTLDRVFHSEADFQHSLAWQIQVKYNNPKIRLERRIDLKDVKPYLDDIYVDIWIETENRIIPIELKYKTDEFSGEIENEKVQLRSQGRHPPNRFDFVADIERIETIIELFDIDRGYAIFLTNDSAYWKPPNKNVIDSDFRLHDSLSGKLTWSDRASPNTKTKKRDRPINLSGKYNLNWKHYHYSKPNTNVKGNKNFRYLIVEIL